MQSNEKYERARRHVNALKGFYVHLSVYVLVNTMLFLINLKAGGPWWFYWPLLGWGIGLAANAIKVFGAGENWEERKIREYMNKHP